MPGTLYLIPVTLGDSPVQHVIPAYVLELLDSLDHFIVEELRSARRYLKKAGVAKAIDDLSFYLLNEHTDNQALEELLGVLTAGQDAGLLSEAGVPAVADPGSGLVALAHRHGIRVVPSVRSLFHPDGIDGLRNERPVIPLSWLPAGEKTTTPDQLAKYGKNSHGNRGNPDLYGNPLPEYEPAGRYRKHLRG